MVDGVVRRLPVKGKDGSIELIEIESIFYLEANGHDTLPDRYRHAPEKIGDGFLHAGGLDEGSDSQRRAPQDGQYRNCPPMGRGRTE